VRKVQAAPRTGRVVSWVPRAIVLAPVCCLAALSKSMRAIEQEGKGRR
jgi:hypothetical protein